MTTAQFLDLLPKLSIFAVLLGAAVAALALYLNRRHERRKLLADEFQKFWASDLAHRVHQILAATATDLTSDPATRKFTLETLSALQRIAFQVSSRPADWDRVLRYDQHQQLVDAVTVCGPLLQILRNTTVPVEVRAWNGHRARAMSALLRALRVRLDRPK
ncbi:MAG: hypothetical protein GC145_08115 [Caulobacter sp.]|nr:hypothetical protein [Caulobacter sp.]